MNMGLDSSTSRTYAQRTSTARNDAAPAPIRPQPKFVSQRQLRATKSKPAATKSNPGATKSKLKRNKIKAKRNEIQIANRSDSFARIKIFQCVTADSS
jgi:hypothetical protein